MPNLVKGLLSEMNRCREILVEYEKLPAPSGTIGAMLIENAIVTAEKAMGEGDTIAMMKCYSSLKDFK